MTPNKEVLIGDIRVLDFLGTEQVKDIELHPLQELLETAVICMLTEDEQEIFWLRYGECLPIRAVAHALGYTNHYIVQTKLERIKAKVKKYLLERRTTNSDT